MTSAKALPYSGKPPPGVAVPRLIIVFWNGLSSILRRGACLPAATRLRQRYPMMFITAPQPSATLQCHKINALAERQCRQIQISMKHTDQVRKLENVARAAHSIAMERSMTGFLRAAMTGPRLPFEPCRRRRAGIRGRLSQPPGALADRLRRRRPGRYRGADHGPVAVGTFRPAIRGGKPRRLRRQHRRRGRGQFRRRTATRCCSSRPTTPSAPRSTRSCLTISSATPCRSPVSCS